MGRRTLRLAEFIVGSALACGAVAAIISLIHSLIKGAVIS